MQHMKQVCRQSCADESRFCTDEEPPEITAYQNLVRRLQETLASHGIQVPPDLQDVQAAGTMARVQLVGAIPQEQRIEAFMPAFDGSAPSPHELNQLAIAEQYGTAGPTRSSQSSSLASSVPSSSNFPPPEHGASETSETRPHENVNGPGVTQVGVNFVLALEQPCLHHHQNFEPPELLAAGSIGSGHLAMLSSPIIARAPTFSFNGRHAERSIGSQWQVPAIELERLLNLSQQIDLNGEITPIQAWQALKHHSSFESLRLEQLQILIDALLPNVKCYG